MQTDKRRTPCLMNLGNFYLNFQHVWSALASNLLKGILDILKRESTAVKSVRFEPIVQKQRHCIVHVLTHSGNRSLNGGFFQHHIQQL